MVKFICFLILKCSGWTFKGSLPDNLRSFVFIGAPHTSNHDFVPAMAVVWWMKRKARFVIKNEWMRFPLGLILKPAGAIGLDRSQLKVEGHVSNVELMADLFKQFPELVLMISPEGTRKPNDKWKTGFYYIAEKAKVPIVLGYGNYKKKEAGVGLIIYPTDFEKDMNTISSFYREIGAKVPENFKTDKKYS